MDWHLSPYVIGVALTTVLSLGVAFSALQQRDRPGGLALAFLMFAVAEWAGCYVLEANAVTIPLKVLWSQVAYIGTMATGPCVLHFAMAVTRPRRQLSLIHLALIWAIPAITVVLAFTNGSHHLIWDTLTFADDSHRILVYGRGPWFFVPVVHVYVLLAFSTLLLVGAARRFHRLYRRRALTILAAALPPWLLNGVYIAFPSVLGRLDWTPVAFAVTGALLVWSLGELQLLELVPVAREHVVESIEYGVMVLDVQGRIIDVNPAVGWLLGARGNTERRRSERGLVGRRAAEALPGALGDAVASALPLPPAGDSWQDVASEGEAPLDGRTIAWRLTPLRPKVRSQPGHLLLLRDVTVQRRAHTALQEINTLLELRVAERTAEIRAEKERGDTILRSVSDGIIMTDRDLYVVYANPAFTDLTGYTVEEALGCTVDMILGTEARPVGARGYVGEEPWRDEVQVRRKDGRFLDVALTFAPVSGEAGDVAGYVGTVRDVSQTKALDRARKSFLDNISHQLRTPVMTLQLYAHLMGQTALPDPNREYLTAMDAQIAWLNHLIQDILEVASIDSGKTLSTWVPVGVDGLVDNLVTRFTPLAEQKGLQLVVSPVPEEAPKVMGDAPRLVQALGELIENAVHFTPAPGVVALKIGVVTRADRRWATIAVSDTGAGIPATEQPRVFDRFFRGGVADTLQVPGTGLGLSIAKAIVGAHGGEITLACASSPPQSETPGTTFTVWLPAI